jgi:hypothetical protein
MTLKVWNSRPLRHICVWLGSWAAFYFMVRLNEGHGPALSLTSAIMLAGPLPVYTHFAVLQRFFERRRYAIYGVALLAIAAASSIWAEVIYGLIERDPNSHINGLGITIFFLTFSTGFRYFGQGMSRRYQLQEAEFKQLQTEMALLRSQVNPHFLFNSLNNLYALSLSEPDRTPEVILKLSGLMRYMLDCSHRKSVSLADEIHFIENYVELERLRLDGSPEIRLEVAGVSGDRQIAPMLLLPFVENGFKHGLPGGNAGGRLLINIELTGDHLRFAVENDKPQPNPPGENRNSGLGLENVMRRLVLLYPEKHRLRIADQERMHRVELDLWL